MLSMSGRPLTQVLGRKGESALQARPGSLSDRLLSGGASQKSGDRRGGLWPLFFLTFVWTMAAIPAMAQESDPFSDLHRLHRPSDQPTVGVSPSFSASDVVSRSGPAWTSGGLCAPVAAADDEFDRIQTQEMADLYSHDLHRTPVRDRIRVLPARYFVIDSRFDPYWDPPPAELRRGSPDGSAAVTMLFYDAAEFSPGGSFSDFDASVLLDTALGRWGASASPASPIRSTNSRSDGSSLNGAFLSLSADLATDRRYPISGHWGLQDYAYQNKATIRKMVTDAATAASGLALRSLAVLDTSPWDCYQRVRNFIVEKRLPALVMLPGSNKAALVVKIVERQDGLAALHFWNPSDSDENRTAAEEARRNVLHVRLSDTRSLVFSGGPTRGEVFSVVTDLGPMYAAVSRSMRMSGTDGVALDSGSTRSILYRLSTGQEPGARTAGTAATKLYWGDRLASGSPYGQNLAFGLRPPVIDFPRGSYSRTVQKSGAAWSSAAKPSRVTGKPKSLPGPSATGTSRTVTEVALAIAPRSSTKSPRTSRPTVHARVVLPRLYPPPENGVSYTDSTTESDVTTGDDLDFRYAGEAGHRFSGKKLDTGRGHFRLLGDPFNSFGSNRYGYGGDGYRSVSPDLGSDPWGYDPYGFDSMGYDPWGFDRRGHDRSGTSISGFPRLLRLRSLYVEDPFDFRSKYDIGPTGEISEITTGHQVWPSDDELHPYHRQ